MDPLGIMDAMRTLLNEGRKVEAARLLPDLNAAVTGEAAMALSSFPVCACCQGYAEMAHPTDANRKVSCAEYPELCPGNKHGRMSPEQFTAYMSTKLDGVLVDPPVETQAGPEPSSRRRREPEAP